MPPLPDDEMPEGLAPLVEAEAARLIDWPRKRLRLRIASLYRCAADDGLPLHRRLASWFTARRVEKLRHLLVMPEAEGDDEQ